LRNSDTCERKGNGNVLHCHGVNPATTFLGINSGLPSGEKYSKPGGQNYLGEGGANGKGYEGIPCGFLAAIFTGRMRNMVKPRSKRSQSVHLG
jgi:hypothetical protein